MQLLTWKKECKDYRQSVTVWSLGPLTELPSLRCWEWKCAAPSSPHIHTSLFRWHVWGDFHVRVEEGGGRVGWQLGTMAAWVRDVRLSINVSSKPLVTFNETSSNFPALSERKLGLSDATTGQFSTRKKEEDILNTEESCLWQQCLWQQNQPKMSSFPKPNERINTALSQHKI